MGSLGILTFRIACDCRPKARGRRGYTADGRTDGHQEIFVFEGKSKSQEGHARVQARSAQVRREEEGREPKAGRRHRAERSAGVRREDPEEEKRGEAKVRAEEEGVTKWRTRSTGCSPISRPRSC